MTFDYTFTRKSTADDPEGYVQPNINSRNEKRNADDVKKVSFVGNSGIKLGSYAGSGVCWEVAILDMEKMVALIGSDSDFKERINDQTEAVNLSGGVNGIDYLPEKISQLMNGVGYNKPLKNIVGSSAGSAEKSYQQLFQENYDRFSGEGGMMKIDYTVSTGTLSVYVWKNGAYVKYYEATGVPITGGELDGRVYIQSHWGSGVTFSNVFITSK